MVLTIEDQNGPVMQVGLANVLVPSRRVEKEAALALLKQAMDLIAGPVIAYGEAPKEVTTARTAS